MFSSVQSLIVVEFLLYFVEAPLYAVRFVLVFLPHFFLLLIYLFSIISTASKIKRTLQKLGVRSGTDPGMNRCTENISHSRLVTKVYVYTYICVMTGFMNCQLIG